MLRTLFIALVDYNSRNFPGHRFYLTVLDYELLLIVI